MTSKSEYCFPNNVIGAFFPVMLSLMTLFVALNNNRNLNIFIPPAVEKLAPPINIRKTRKSFNPSEKLAIDR